jgi:GDPmannose 4,6-dehydratase
MLQQDEADDYVAATGEKHTVREFIEKSFAMVDMPIKWEGKDEKEKGINTKTGKVVIEVDPKYFRPTEVELLIGNPAKAKKKLGWEPKVKFNELVKIMTEADFDAAKKGLI